MPDLAEIEAQLTEAWDALAAIWEQGEGAVCFLAVSVADDALAAYRALDGAVVAARDTDGWRRVTTLAGDVARLRAPLDGMEWGVQGYA